MKTINLPSWSSLAEAITNVSKRREELKMTNNGWQFEPLVYRGLADSKWKLETTLERAYPNEAATPITDMSNYYRNAYAIKQEIRRIGKPPKDLWSNLPTPPVFDKSLQQIGETDPLLFFKRKAWYRFLVYLRHQGVPSPLLDWTESPHIAAFFAFNNMPKDSKHVSIYAMLRGVYRSNSPIGKQASVPAPYVGALSRHTVQQAQYSLCCEWTEFPCKFANHRAFIEKNSGLKFGELVKWNIPARERLVALKYLDKVSVNSLNLLANPDDIVRTFARRELLLRS